MKIFRDYTLRWWEISVLKLTVLSFGLLVGSQWPNVFLKYSTIPLVIFIAGTIYLVVVLFKKPHA